MLPITAARYTTISSICLNLPFFHIVIMTERVLTGITPSGTPHLGNYAGMIRPAIAASRAQNSESFFFLADWHSLIKTQDPDLTQRSTLEIAASWLACGLEPEVGKVWLYRQSDIPEVAELNWLLTAVAGKGVLNRAHAYKAAVDKNRLDGLDDDAGINAGLFMYPVLMAADILIFNAHKVPVGRDQVQHIEMARDFAQRFNHIYGHDYFVLPQATIDEQVATLAGLDGRKMSKSYGNTIELFSPRAELKKKVFSIITDARLPGECKDSQGSALFQLYQAFASKQQTEEFAQAFEQGIAWGEAKEQLFACIDRQLTPMRERYYALMAAPEKIEALLQQHGEQLRQRYAIPLLKKLRHAVGLRNLAQVNQPQQTSAEKKITPPQFKQYRETDGRFYFKFIDEHGQILIQSEGFASPREAGQQVAALKQTEQASDLHNPLLHLHASADSVLLALQRLRQTL